jgi:hypothetical protein
LRACVLTREEVFGPRSWQAAAAANALGQCLAAMGRWTEAERLLIQSCQTVTETTAAPVDTQRAILETMVRCFENRGLIAQAAGYRARLQALGE